MLTALPVAAGPVRVAFFNTDLSRRDPGLLVHALLKPESGQVDQVVAIIQQVRPDILVLGGIDYDHGGVAIGLLRQKLNQAGNPIDYPYWFSAPVNAGEPSGLDLNADLQLATPRDAWGFGYFPGQDGMAILSRYPIDLAGSHTFQNLIWAEMGGAVLPAWPDGSPFPDAATSAAMRLSSAAHWDVQINLPDGPIRVLTAHPTPHVFDGEENLNGRRNHDEIMWFERYLSRQPFTDDAGRKAVFSGGPFVIAADLNADPSDRSNHLNGIATLLDSPYLTDPMPRSNGGPQAAALTDPGRPVIGNPATDTVDWPEGPGQPGNMRVDYVLPASSLIVNDSGVFWPDSNDPLHHLIDPQEDGASRHRLVWVDLSFQ